MSRRLLIAATVVICTLSASSASANTRGGLRVGVTDDPDSIFVGGLAEVPLSVSRSGTLFLEPGVDVGFGDEGPFDYFTIRGTLNFKFLIPVNRQQRLYAYPLGGMSLYYINIDDCGFDDCDDTEAGINLGGGFRFDRFALELWLSFEDIPDLTFAFLVTL